MGGSIPLLISHLSRGRERCREIDGWGGDGDGDWSCISVKKMVVVLQRVVHVGFSGLGLLWAWIQ